MKVIFSKGTAKDIRDTKTIVKLKSGSFCEKVKKNGGNCSLVDTVNHFWMSEENGTEIPRLGFF